jgi:hypothetical protein
VINSTDYFLYLPLMPQVAGEMVEPRHICVSLPRRLRKARFVLGTVDHVDSRQKAVSWSGPERAARCTFVVIGAGWRCAPATRGRRTAIRGLMRGGAEDRGPKHRATRGSGERPLAVGCGGILAWERQGEAAAKGRARPLAAFERMSPPASIERAIRVGSQRGLHGPQSASFDWRGGRHARCHR